jgi:predicted amidohydrolase YtcJ
MDLDPHADLMTTRTALVVADWKIDPRAIVATCRAQSDAALRIVVPAWLHGLDWAGDPWASVPCARRQLERLVQLCTAAGLHVESAAVGDPNPLSAIDDALDACRSDEILLFAHGRHVARHYPLSLANRAERLTGLRVQRIAAPRVARERRRLVLAGGHCEPGRRPQVA